MIKNIETDIFKEYETSSGKENFPKKNNKKAKGISKRTAGVK